VFEHPDTSRCDPAIRLVKTKRFVSRAPISLVLVSRRFDEDPPSPNLDFSVDLALDARMLMKEEENHAALYLPFLAGSRSGGGRRQRR